MESIFTHKVILSFCESDGEEMEHIVPFTNLKDAEELCTKYDASIRVTTTLCVWRDKDNAWADFVLAKVRSFLKKEKVEAKDLTDFSLLFAPRP